MEISPLWFVICLFLDMKTFARRISSCVTHLLVDSRLLVKHFYIFLGLRSMSDQYW